MPYTAETMPVQIVVRLDRPARSALAVILSAIQAPHRSQPTVSDGVRAALLATAKAMTDDRAAQAGTAPA